MPEYPSLEQAFEPQRTGARLGFEFESRVFVLFFELRLLLKPFHLLMAEYRFNMTMLQCKFNRS